MAKLLISISMRKSASARTSNWIYKEHNGYFKAGGKKFPISINKLAQRYVIRPQKGKLILGTPDYNFNPTNPKVEIPIKTVEDLKTLAQEVGLTRYNVKTLKEYYGFTK